MLDNVTGIITFTKASPRIFTKFGGSIICEGISRSVADLAEATWAAGGGTECSHTFYFLNSVANNTETSPLTRDTAASINGRTATFTANSLQQPTLFLWTSLLTVTLHHKIMDCTFKTVMSRVDTLKSKHTVSIHII